MWFQHANLNDLSTQLSIASCLCLCFTCKVLGEDFVLVQLIFLNNELSWLTLCYICGTRHWNISSSRMKEIDKGRKQDLNTLDVLTPELFKCHSEFSITISLKRHARILTGLTTKCQAAPHREAFSRVEPRESQPEWIWDRVL